MTDTPHLHLKNQFGMLPMKSVKIYSLILAATSTLITFTPQFAPKAIAQSVTAQSCVADIIGEDIGSQVNIRSGAGTIFNVIGTVSVGNLVIVVNDDQDKSGIVSPLRRTDSQGDDWYLTTRLRQSPYKGWIRADFLQLKCPNP